MHSRESVWKEGSSGWSIQRSVVQLSRYVLSRYHCLGTRESSSKHALPSRTNGDAQRSVEMKLGRSWCSGGSCVLWMAKDDRAKRAELDQGSFGYNLFTVSACLTGQSLRLTLSGSQWEHLHLLMFTMSAEGSTSKDLGFEAILPFTDQIFKEGLQCVWHWATNRCSWGF